MPGLCSPDSASHAGSFRSWRDRVRSARRRSSARRLTVSADPVTTPLPTLRWARVQGWLEAQWTVGRHRADDDDRGAVLVVDEIQKIPDWSSVVKALWDADTAAGQRLQVVLLGSAPLLVQRGLTESLAGRFELTRVRHWSFDEMRTAFGFDLNTYLVFGGYPGAAPLVRDEGRWRAYILDSLIETSIARDVLLLNRVTKPALLRQLFGLACAYSGQVLSYNKMLGQLQDAGNTTTLAHYLELLGGAGRTVAVEVKATTQHRRTTGLDTFRSIHDPDKILVVGAGGLDLETFLVTDPAEWLTPAERPPAHGHSS